MTLSAIRYIRLTVAQRTVANFIEKASRLYEQKRSAVSSVSPLEMYVRRWLGWAKAGVWLDGPDGMFCFYFVLPLVANAPVPPWIYPFDFAAPEPAFCC